MMDRMTAAKYTGCLKYRRDFAEIALTSLASLQFKVNKKKSMPVVLRTCKIGLGSGWMKAVCGSVLTITGSTIQVTEPDICLLSY